MGKALEIVESWSFDRNYEENPHFKVFNLVLVISLKHWKSAYEFVKTNGTFLQFDHQETPEEIISYFAMKNSTSLSESKIKAHLISDHLMISSSVKKLFVRSKVHLIVTSKTVSLVSFN